MREQVLRDVLARLSVEVHGKVRPLNCCERELVAATLAAVEVAGYEVRKKG